MQFTAVQQTTLANGWLAPNGTFYDCGSFNHCDCANAILNDSSIISSGWELETRGWVHISCDVVRNLDQVPTQDQIDMLWDMVYIDAECYLSQQIQEYLHQHS